MGLLILTWIWQLGSSARAAPALSVVAVRAEYRRRGIGAALLFAMASSLVLALARSLRGRGERRVPDTATNARRGAPAPLALVTDAGAVDRVMVRADKTGDSRLSAGDRVIGYVRHAERLARLREEPGGDELVEAAHHDRHAAAGPRSAGKVGHGLQKVRRWPSLSRLAPR